MIKFTISIRRQEAQEASSLSPEVSGLMKELMVISFMHKLYKPCPKGCFMKFR